MPIRTIRFQGSTRGRPGWLAPLVLALAAVGGIFVLLGAAFLGLITMAAGSLFRLLGLPTGRAAEAPSVFGRLFKSLFSRGASPGGWRGSQERAAHPEPGETGNPPKTISLDRDRDGVWRP